MSTIKLSVTGVKNEGNVHSASTIPPHMTYNNDTHLSPSAVTSNRFSSPRSAPTTVIDLPLYPLQAHIHDYPPPRVIDTTSAPSFENIATGSFLPVCTQPQTGTQLNVLRQTLHTVASAVLSAVIFPVVNLGGGVSFQFSGEPAAGGALPLPVTAVADASEESDVIAILKYALFLLAIGSIIVIRILA